MIRTPYKKSLLLSCFLFTVAAFASLISAQPAVAVTGGDWRSGRIMDEAVFRDKNTMGAQQIQTFLGVKNPNCDTNGTKPSEYGGGTRAQYAASIGLSPPFTCLKDYREGGRSAAQIIADAGQQYGVNPQVLIALLQKEQNLVTDEWPWPIQYRSATGYGCPDTAACDSQYYGLTNQINWAAKMFKGIINKEAGWYSPYVTGNNQVKYNPQSACGASNVSIENWPTAALYSYTPYQPNQAALSNLYGTGDGCSSYGNRNFWRIFNDWFGSGLGGPFNWTITDLYIMDEGKNVNMGTDYLHRNERLFVVVKGKNIGTETWYKDQVGPNPARLGTWRSPGHSSVYCDILWLRMSQSCTRAASLNEDMVRPGDTFHFETYIHAPAQGGEFREYFQPLLEGRAWMSNDPGFHLYVNSVDYFDWRWGSFGAWTDQTKSTPANLDNLARGQQVYVELKAKNTTATEWTNSGRNIVHLGTSSPQDRNSQVCLPSWITCTRPAGLVQSSILPGQTGTFAFTLKAPETIGTYREHFKPIMENLGWMRDDHNHIYLNVTH